MAQPERELRQGDWLKNLPPLPIVTAAEQPDQIHQAPHGAVVITQCCDLAQNHSGTANVAPVVQLDPNSVAQVRRGSTSRYAPLDGNFYVDLAVDFPVQREVCDTAELLLRMTDEQRQSFAARISRRLTRFGYPGSLYPMLEPFKKAIRSKALKENQAAQVLQLIDTLRMECEPDWNATEDLSLTLLVVVDNDELPTSPEQPIDPTMQDPLTAQIMLGGSVPWILSTAITSGPIVIGPPATDIPPPPLMQAAAEILDSAATDPTRAFLWDQFGRSLAALLNQGAQDVEPGLIADIEVEVLRADELTYSRYQASVDLDLDDLSPPITGP